MNNNLRMEAVKQIIKRNVDEFIVKITDRTDINGGLRTYKSDFPIFYPANEYYFEYRRSEDLLERYIREYLVTGILCSLLSDKNVSPETDVLTADEPSKVIHLARYDNNSYGDEYPFAFILQTKNSRIGIRYSSIWLKEKELRKQLKRYRIDHIEIIDWSDTDDLDSKKINQGFGDCPQDKVFFVTLHRFIATHFSEEIYRYYILCVRNAVQEANRIIGFQTIPALSLRYISDFKADFLVHIANDSIRSRRYHIFDGDGNYTHETEVPLSEEDYDILDNRFFAGGLYKALVGGEDFAKCFITSEYLYTIFETGNTVSFDYSAVATGYFKSVELLLDKIKQIWLQHSEIHKDIWIQGGNLSLVNNGMPWCRKNPAPRAKGTQVFFQREYENYFKTEMGSLIWLLHDNPNGWLIVNGRDIIHKCLLNYSQGCRNEHLHKDIIDDITVLRPLRENTILCLYFLLGGCRLTNSLSEDAAILSLENDSFERLYKKLKSLPRSITKYYIQFVNQESPVMAFRLYDQEQTVYDKAGKIISPIRFVLVNDFSDMIFNSDEEYLELVCVREKLDITPDNVPIKMWWYNSRKGKVEIKW